MVQLENENPVIYTEKKRVTDRVLKSKNDFEKESSNEIIKNEIFSNRSFIDM